MTLEKLLKGGHSTSTGPITLTRRERYKIAAMLASSFLQFHATPWLRKDWSKKDILFLEAEGNDARRPMIVERPYVARDYKSIPSSGDGTVEGGTPLEGSFDDPSDSLFRLGVILLELCFGQALEDHPRRHEYFGPEGQINDFTDRITACKWAEDVLGEGGFEFHNAIQRCLKYAWGPRDADFVSDDFKNDIYVDVIQPLDEVSKRFCGGS